MNDTTKLLEQLLAAWRTNNKINLFLIDRISPAGMKCTLSKRGGRNVVRQFAHIHNNRIWQLEGRAKELAEGMYKFDTAEEPTKQKLKAEMNRSAKAIEQFFADIHERLPKRKTFKKGVVAHLGYLISHEAHHRGSILLTIKECGHNLASTDRYKIWDWDRS
jgi:uncharacterized damage-inducible protein DinB